MEVGGALLLSRLLGWLQGHRFVKDIVALFACLLRQEHVRLYRPVLLPLRREHSFAPQVLYLSVFLILAHPVEVRLQQLEHLLKVLHLLFQVRLEYFLVAGVPEGLLAGGQAHAYEGRERVRLQMILGRHQLDVELERHHLEKHRVRRVLPVQLVQAVEVELDVFEQLMLPR